MVVRVVIFASSAEAWEVASWAARWVERRSDSRRIMRGSGVVVEEEDWSVWDEDCVERVSRRVVSSVAAESAED